MDAEERMWAAVLVALAERTPSEVMHEVIAGMSPREAQMIVEGVQFARELLAKR